MLGVQERGERKRALEHERERAIEKKQKSASPTKNKELACRLGLLLNVR